MEATRSGFGFSSPDLLETIGTVDRSVLARCKRHEAEAAAGGTGDAVHLAGGQAGLFATPVCPAAGATLRSITQPASLVKRLFATGEHKLGVAVPTLQRFVTGKHAFPPRRAPKRPERSLPDNLPRRKMGPRCCVILFAGRRSLWTVLLGTGCLGRYTARPARLRECAMRVSCLQENLKRGLSIVGRAVNAKTTLPITGNILIATDDGRLRLSATNLEIGITCWIGAKVEEEGAITIPARLISEFVNTLPNDRIDMTLTGKSLRLKCARFEARMNGQDADDFPVVASYDSMKQDGASVSLDAAVLREAITQVAFAAASDEARPVLAGVLTKIGDDEVTLAAADGFRLSVRRIAVLEPPEVAGPEIIVPARALTELSRLLGDQEDPVKVVIPGGKNQILFHLNGVDLVSQLIQGNFPNYTQLIPQDFASRVIIDTHEFLAATRPAAIFARDSNGIVRLEMFPGDESVPGKMLIRARAEELGDNQGEIDANVSGETAKIAFNAKYLTDILSVLTADQVALETKSPSSPGVLRPVGSDTFTHVIMPMFVQW